MSQSQNPSQDQIRSILQQAVQSQSGAKQLENLIPRHIYPFMSFFAEEREERNLRQMAGLMVKRSIKMISRETRDEQQCVGRLMQLGLDPSTTMNQCMTLLMENHSKIRNTACMLLNSFAQYTNNVENLSKILIEQIFPKNSYAALKCLAMLLEENVSASRDARLFQHLLEFTMKVLQGDVQIGAKARAKAFQILTTLLNNYYNHGKLSVGRQQAQVILTIISQVFSSLDGAQDAESLVLKVEAIKTLLGLTHFKQDLVPIKGEVVNFLLTILKKQYSKFEKEFILVSPDEASLDSDAGYDSEGGVISDGVLTSQVIEVLIAMLSYDEFELDEYLKSMCAVVLKFAQRTHEDEEKIRHNSNSFYAEDEDSRFASIFTSPNNLGAAVFSFVNVMVEMYSLDALSHLFTFANQYIEQSNQLYQEKNQFWWKPREAAISILNSVSDDVEEQEEEEMLSFIKKVMSSLAENDLNPQAPPLLQFTALHFLSCYAYLLKSSGDTGAQFFERMMPLLSDGMTLSVRLSGALATSKFITEQDVISSNIASQYVKQLVGVYFQLMSTCTEDTIHVPLQALASVLKFPQAVEVLSQQENLGTIFLNAYFTFANDPLVSMEVIEVIKTLLSHRNTYTQCVQGGVPRILEVWKNTSAKSSFLIGTVIDLLEKFVRFSNEDDAKSLLDAVLIPLITLMEKNDDDTVLQNGDDCLRTFIHKHPSLMVSYKLQNGKVPLQSILDVVAKQLNLGMPQPACAGVGTLLVSLLTKCGESIDQNIFNTIVRQVLTRMTCATDLTLLQSLIFFFAKLFHSHYEPLCNLLKSLSPNDFVYSDAIKNPEKASKWTDGLSAVLDMWTENSHFFFGKYQRNVIATALGTVLLKCDKLNDYQSTVSTLSSGDFQENPNQARRPVTRSRAKKMQKDVPMSLKIFNCLCQLFAQEYDTRLEETRRKKLEFSSLKYLLPSDKQHPRGDFDDDELLYLSSLADGDDEDDPHELDPFTSEDPLSQVDLYEVLPDLIRKTVQRFGNDFLQYSLQFQESKQKELLQLCLQQA